MLGGFLACIIRRGRESEVIGEMCSIIMFPRALLGGVASTPFCWFVLIWLDFS